MSLILAKPTGTKLTLAKEYTRPDDADAVAYIAAVEAADGQALETATRMAINSFVKGCKADGIWPAIKASCILAGARTLTGALVPLAGTAPTNNNFVSGDYNRKTGLMGNGSTKSLNSNRANNADPQNSAHAFVYTSTPDSRYNTATAYTYIGAANNAFTSRRDLTFLNENTIFACHGNTTSQSLGNPSNGMGVVRSSSSQINGYFNGSLVGPISNTSVSPDGTNIRIFARGELATSQIPTNARLAFYSIGESLDLALLDARVTDLINAFGAAIP